jgi:hypothetical protein
VDIGERDWNEDSYGDYMKDWQAARAR